jgi:hypothetical protein
MLRALLDGRKTQTRRIIKLPHQNPLGKWEPTTVGGGGSFYRDGTPAPERVAIWHTRTGDCICTSTQPGDRLWVRERVWLPEGATNKRGHITYAADHGVDRALKWTPSIHMPRWASRLTLEVTGVKVERVQDISHQDATAEGVDASGPVAVNVFHQLWDSIHGPGAWEKNPWVYALTFKA